LIALEIQTINQGAGAWKDAKLFRLSSTEVRESCKNKRISYEKWIYKKL
jgi:hypothetical protein